MKRLMSLVVAGVLALTGAVASAKTSFTLSTPDPDNAEITLTESNAMLPTSAVSGFYFAHPESQYFGVARIGRDQLEDYAARCGVDVSVAERWLRPNLD